MDILSQWLALFHKGGLVMYPILVCSVLVIAIGIERWKVYSQAEAKADFPAALQQLLEDNQWDQALALCKANTGLIPAIAAKGMEKNNYANLSNILEGAAALAAARLKDRLSYLETIVTLAPLLGLLGTVMGMINSFSVMAIKTSSPHAITGGVGEALVATAAGLCVAVLALVVHSYYSQRLDRLITNMETVFTALVEAADRRR